MSRFFGRKFRLMVVAVSVTAACSAGGVLVTSADAAEPTAEQAAEQARVAHAAGRLEEAIQAYARAYQLGGDPSMLFNMAEAHRQAGHDVEAARTFQTYLRRDRKAGVHRESAERQLRELGQKAHAGAVAPTKPVAASPAVVSPVSTSSTAPAVPAAPAAASLPPTSPAPAAAPATVVPPAMAPEVVPTPVGAAPASSPVILPPASNTAGSEQTTDQTAGSAGGRVPAAQATAAASVDLTTTAQPAASTKQLPMPRWVPWTLGAVTLAAGSAAIVAGLSASHRYDELNTTCGRTAEGCGNDRIDDVKGRARRANILWAVTGVAAVATGVTVYVNADAAGVSGLWSF